MALSKSQKFEIAKKKEYTSLKDLSSEYEVSKATIKKLLLVFVKGSYKDGQM